MLPSTAILCTQIICKHCLNRSRPSLSYPSPVGLQQSWQRPITDALPSRSAAFGTARRETSEALNSAVAFSSASTMQQPLEQHTGAVTQTAASMSSDSMSSLPTTPAARRKLPSALLYLLPLASLVYLLLLPQHPLIAQRIYTDENAWAADGAREAITEADMQHAQHVQRTIMHTSHTDAAAAADTRSVIAHTWRAMGMDVHTYHHQHDKRSRWTGETSELTYAIIPSRMGDGKEAVALVVDYDPRDVDASLADSTMSAVGVASGLARYLLGVPWLARDVLLIAVENNGNKKKAIDALGGWLHTYRSPSSSPQPQHHNTSAHPSSSPSSPPSSTFTFHRSGSILAALCLDIPLNTSLTSTFTLHVGGLYGLSPNLDIVSVLLHMLHRRAVTTTIADTFPHTSPLSAAYKGGGYEWLRDEHKGLIRSMVHHVTGEATGFHGHFIANNIDAITLQAVPPPPSTSSHTQHQSRDFTVPLLLALDAFCHSLNNLIEKLHHSTWLYLLVSPTHFVTMSKYVYAFALLAAPLPLLALTRLYGGGREKQWMQAGGVAVWLYAVGWSIVAAGVLMRGMGSTMVQAAVILSVAGGSALCGAATFGSRLLGGGTTGGGDLDWRTLQAIVLLVTFFIVSPLAILNFPLSITLLVTIIPLAIHVQPIERHTTTTTSRLSSLRHGVLRVSQLVVLVVWSPVMLFVCYVLYLRADGSSVADAMAGVLDGMSYVDNLLYVLLPGVYLPVYMMSWMLWLLPLPVSDTAESAADVMAAGTQKKLQ